MQPTVQIEKALQCRNRIKHTVNRSLPAGLSTASNQFMQDEMADKEQKRLLMQYTDQLRLSMAGNLQDYQTESYEASAWCRYSWNGMQLLKANTMAIATSWKHGYVFLVAIRTLSVTVNCKKQWHVAGNCMYSSQKEMQA